ncbi:DUF2332 domain-containing protein [Salinithrix halophila]|uniref:DUF2332 domain-containing protein n=1 Tax=Salinithrix halophila TaxID=1485204 RepID=A0ABV8JM08_9BACL
MVKKERLSTLFKHFSLHECKNSSNLYEHLAFKVSEDEELLDIASHAQAGQPVPNLLFGAVHYLLLKGKHHELRQFYRSLVNHPQEVERAFPPFRDFCLSFKRELIPILQEKLVQTNEVRRCAYLYPSFCFIYRQVKKPLSLLEIGTSAGLQLLWDLYQYDYGDDRSYGHISSDILIRSEVKGNHQPFLLPESPPVALRFGVDLHINNLSNYEDTLWMRSLIWPEHKERVELFEKTVTVLKEQSLELIQGDGVELLPHIAEQIPEDTALCIFHTHVANQMPEESKLELMNHIQSIGKKRDVFHVYNNMWDRALHLDSFIDGRESNRVLAETEGHARWFEWKM